MKPLTVELTKGNKRQFQSIGWTTPNDGDCRRKFFALDESGKSLILTLKPAVPEWYLPGFKAVLSCEPFPEAVCIEILRCRLLPPPCYQSHVEFESQHSHNDLFGPRRGNASGAPEQVLILEPSDDEPLQARLDEWLTVMGAAYERERDSLLQHVVRLKSASLAELALQTEKDRSKRIEHAEGQLAIIESETPIDGVPCKGRLKLTLDDVKQGCEGIRDAFLHEDWAGRTGEDLAAMAKERWVHRNWLQGHTGTPSNTFYAETKQKLLEVAPPVFGTNYERDTQFQAACVKVRYRARFADNANSVVYLEDIETREELSAAEHDEVAKLTGAFGQGLQTTEKFGCPQLAPSKSTHSPDAKFEFVNVQGTEFRKAGPHMVRRGDLAEHQRTTKDASGFRSLLELHPERCFYPVKYISEVREAANHGTKLPAVASFDITDWDSSWHPPGAPNWRHPGKQSEPNRVNQG